MTEQDSAKNEETNPVKEISKVADPATGVEPTIGQPIEINGDDPEDEESRRSSTDDAKMELAEPAAGAEPTIGQPMEIEDGEDEDV